MTRMGRGERRRGSGRGPPELQHLFEIAADRLARHCGCPEDGQGQDEGKGKKGKGKKGKGKGEETVEVHGHGAPERGVGGGEGPGTVNP